MKIRLDLLEVRKKLIEYNYELKDDNRIYSKYQQRIEIWSAPNREVWYMAYYDSDLSSTIRVVELIPNSFNKLYIIENINELENLKW